MIYNNVFSLKLVTGETLISALVGDRAPEECGYVTLCQPMELIEVYDDDDNLVGKRLQFWQPESMDSEMYITVTNIVTINHLASFWKKKYSLILWKYVTQAFDSQATTSQNFNMVH